MIALLGIVAWIACVIYSTIPAFWLLIHPRAGYWRSRRSPYKILLPIWIGMWLIVAVSTVRWRGILLYETRWTWIPAGILFGTGVMLYKLSHSEFSLRQLGGLPEVLSGHTQQRLATTGIRSRVRHPIYLAHLCEMLAWSLGTGLAVCWVLTVFGMVTGAVMIRMEDRELEQRFGEEYLRYRSAVSAFLPRPGRKI